MRVTPRTAKWILSFYGPYLGAGIRVEHISDNWQQMTVSMRLRWYNRNLFGTHFGGSLYSMVDPHLAIMLFYVLGDEYIVWDKAASIDFIAPGRGKVTAQFEITDQDILDIKQQTQSGEKTLPAFDVYVVDESGKKVAHIHKTLYVKRKSASS